MFAGACVVAILRAFLVFQTMSAALWSVCLGLLMLQPITHALQRQTTWILGTGLAFGGGLRVEAACPYVDITGIGFDSRSKLIALVSMTLTSEVA